MLGSESESELGPITYTVGICQGVGGGERLLIAVKARLLNVGCGMIG